MSAGIAHATGADIDFHDSPDVAGTFILDVRGQALCEKASLAGARCLPVDQLLGPNRRLPNISGLLWLFGTVGLTGDEHVLVVGDKNDDKTFMAGLLYVAGQNKVTVMTSRLSDQKTVELAPGMSRSKTREKVFQAQMRDGSIILRQELSQAISARQPLTILDARSEAEYWGRVLTTPRGGHVPGAILFAAGDLPLKGSVIVYGRDTVDGLSALAQLVSQGVEVRVLMDGWAGWAADGALPVDAVTYADVSQRQQKTFKAQPPAEQGTPRLLIAAGVLMVGAFGAGYFVRWLMTGNKG